MGKGMYKLIRELEVMLQVLVGIPRSPREMGSAGLAIESMYVILGEMDR